MFKVDDEVSIVLDGAAGDDHLPSIPGPRIDVRRSPEGSRQRARKAPDPARPEKRHVRLGNWFSATLPRGGKTQSSVASDATGVEVLVDGYLTDAPGGVAGPGGAAATILTLYKKTRLQCLPELRGSFTIVICDSAEATAYLVTDRVGSRPMNMMSTADGDLRLGPELRCLVSDEDWPRIPLDPVAVAEFLVFGAFYGNHTLFQGVTSLPQASVITFTAHGHQARRYWQIGYHPRDDGDTSPWVDRCDDLIQRAVDRTLRATSSPFLLLSGGVDSRVLLGALLNAGARLPVVIYGTEGSEDLAAASALARRFGLKAIKHVIPNRDLHCFFRLAATAADCRAETIDSPTNTFLWRTLGSQFDTFLNGDEAFGWHHSSVQNGKDLSPAQAIHAVGFRTLHQVARLHDWLRPEVRPIVRGGLDSMIQYLAPAEGVHSGVDLMDTLYYEQRLGNMLNAFTIPRLRFMEQARPLIDEDIIDFVTSLPVRLRYDKRLLRTTLALKYSELMSVPLAKKPSIPVVETYRRLFREDEEMQKFLTLNLLQGFDWGVGSLLDLDRVTECFDAFMEGSPLPSVRIPFWCHLPGVWRFYRVTNEVQPAILLLRLLQLNLYLSNRSPNRV